MVTAGTEKASIAAMPIDDSEDEEPVLWRDLVINPIFADRMMGTVIEFHDKHLVTDIPPEGNWEKDRETIKRMFPREVPEQVVETTDDACKSWANKEERYSIKSAITN